MKRRIVTCLFFLTLLIGCQSVEVDAPQLKMEERLARDTDFQSLVQFVLDSSGLAADRLISSLSELEPVLDQLETRYLRSTSKESLETFCKVFSRETGFETSFERLPVRTFDTAYPVNAPLGRVWETLVEIEAYPEWNPFTPEVATTFIPGSLIVMHVRLFPAFPEFLIRQEETVTSFEFEQAMCWESVLSDSFFFRSHRCYEVSSIEEEETLLVNNMVYEGILAPWIYSLTRNLVLQGFKDVSLALKDRLED